MLQRARESEDLVPPLTIDGDHIGQRHLPGGHRSRLVEQDGVDLVRGFQHLRPLDQDAQLRTPAGTDQQRCGGRESQGAGARDDQHRHRCRERRRDGSARADPESKCRNGQRDDDRHEDTGDPVRQPLSVRLSVLSVLDQSAYLCQCRVGADPARPHHQSSVGVDCCTDDVGTRFDLHRYRLTGQQRRVDRRTSRYHHAIGGDLLARANHELVADGQLTDRDALLGTASAHRHILGAEFQHRSQCRTCAAPGPGLEISAGQNQGGDSRGGLEIDVPASIGAPDRQLECVCHARCARGTPEQRVHRPPQRRQGSHRDQGVHGRGPVAQVRPRRPMERPCAPEDHRRSQCQR